MSIKLKSKEKIDAAIGNRVDELENAAIITLGPPQVPKAIQLCKGRSKVAWIDRHFNGLTRATYKEGLVNFLPGGYGKIPKAYSEYLTPDIVILQTAPIDKHGFFNYGISNSETNGLLSNAKCVIVETNPNVPICLGGNGEYIHFSDVNYIVEGESEPLMESIDVEPSSTEEKIAENTITLLEDGCCIQLGIGALPNAIGNLICESDITDIGVHTEMLTQAYVNMYKAGKITGKNKTLDKGKMVYTFAMGTKELYDFLDQNPVCSSYSVDYTNDPSIISKNEKMISINSAVEVDLFSQVSSESVGPNQISGTGGQLDFTLGAFNSNGGKGLICLTSTVTSKTGEVLSRFKPTFAPGTIVSLPRSLTHTIVTEYGIAQMKGQSTWTRAEALINIAHPDFRDDLIKEAEKMKIWRYTNKKI